MALTTFDPATNGFHFPNSLINQVLGGLITTRGRCGGMAYAALDYYFAELPVPTHRSGDFGPGAAVPPDGSVLADYIYDRLLDSFLANVGHWANVALNPFFNPVDFTRAHIPAILGDLDLGRPVPLGLIATRNPLEIGSNHQVVAYGYEVNAAASSLTLFIYDNNAPDVPVTLTTNPTNPVSMTYSTGQKWIGFFKEEYSTKRPTYLDLGLADGLDLTLTGESKTLTLPLHLRIGLVPSNLSVTLQFQDVGAPLTAAYTVKNFGAFPAHLEKFSLPVTGPAGTDEAVLSTRTEILA